MDSKIKVDIADFRTETRAWLEENCPKSMCKPIKDASDFYLSLIHISEPTRPY